MIASLFVKAMVDVMLSTEDNVTTLSLALEPLRLRFGGGGLGGGLSHERDVEAVCLCALVGTAILVVGWL